MATDTLDPSWTSTGAMSNVVAVPFIETDVIFNFEESKSTVLVPVFRTVIECLHVPLILLSSKSSTQSRCIFVEITKLGLESDDWSFLL